MEISSRKRCREDSPEPDLSQRESKRMRLDFDVEELDSCSELHFPELLLLLDQPVEAAAVEDLESVIRSFEEEILAPAPEAQMELGFLFEASDDELGLPPPAAEGKAEADFGELLGFEDEFSSYNWLGLGELVDDGEVVEDGFGLHDDAGLFKNELVVERSEILYRPESLPAL